MNLKLISPVLAAGILHSTAAAVTITFEDGLVSSTQPGGTAVLGHYADQGMYSSNLRFHLGTFTGNVPFNFEDDWGAVVDFGVFGTGTGFIQFNPGAEWVQIDALAQSEFGLEGAEPYSWSITAFDHADHQIGFVSENFGFDFAGEPNPPNEAPYPLAKLSLSLSGIGTIARIEVTPNRKFAIDTIRFGRTVQPVPESVGTLWLLALGIGGCGSIRRFTGKR